MPTINYVKGMWGNKHSAGIVAHAAHSRVRVKSLSGSAQKYTGNYHIADNIKKYTGPYQGQPLTPKLIFLTVKNSSIGDLVTHSLTDSLTVLLLLIYKERP